MTRNVLAEIREVTRGNWLEDGAIPDEESYAFYPFCDLITTCIADTVMSLSMFNEATDRLSRQAPRAKRLEEAKSEEERLYTDRVRELGLSADDSRCGAIREEARRITLAARWALEGGPEAYRRRVPFIHAKSFVSSLAMLQRSLEALAGYHWSEAVTTDLDGICLNFSEAFPGLKELRDSDQHSDERAQGEAYRKKIDTQPLLSGPVLAPEGGVMIAESLKGHRYERTIADGSVAAVEISDATTETARAAVQAAFDALPWMDPERFSAVEPSF